MFVLLIRSISRSRNVRYISVVLMDFRREVLTPDILRLLPKARVLYMSLDSSGFMSKVKNTVIREFVITGCMILVSKVDLKFMFVAFA